MKTMRLLKNTLAMAMLVSCLWPRFGYTDMQTQLAPTTHKAQHCTTRPLTDFLNAQGSTVLFFPPVRDMVAWTDLAFVNFALVDYAGLADAYLGGALGTSVHGTVLECVKRDGRTQISVDLHTTRALGFAQSIAELLANNLDFLNTPTIFGNKAQDVLAGAAAAVGPAKFRMTFYIAYPGAALPDIRPAFQSNAPDVRPITLDFKSTTRGTLADGTNARLHVHQVAATDATGTLVFSKEIVDLDEE